MNDVFAAPASGLPFLSIALVSQDAAAEAPPSHFLMKDVLAAPVNGLPLDDTARASQLDAAGVTTAAGAPDLAGAAGADRKSVV